MALVKGATDVATVAARHGVSEAEVLTWKEMFLDGLEAGVRRSRSPIPPRRVVMSAALSGS